mgnify:CR=1 FL=1
MSISFGTKCRGIQHVHDDAMYAKPGIRSCDNVGFIDDLLASAFHQRRPLIKVVARSSPRSSSRVQSSCSLGTRTSQHNTFSVHEHIANTVVVACFLRRTVATRAHMVVTLVSWQLTAFVGTQSSWNRPSSFL